MSRASLSAGWGKWKKTPFNRPGPSSGDKIPIEKFRDVFRNGATLTDLWPGSYGANTIVNGRARVPCDTDYNAIVSASKYTLENSLVYAQVFPNASGGATIESFTEMFVLSGTAGTDLGFAYNAITNDIGMFDRTGYFDPGSVSITYNASTMRYWRIVSHAGVIYWDTSPDGITWTERRNKPAAPAWTSQTNLALSLQCHRNNGTNDFAEFDNVNVIPVSGTMTAGAGAITPTLSAVRGRHGILTAGPFAIAPTLLAETITPDIVSDPYILITNENLEVVGDPVAAYAIDVIQKFNEPDSGSFTTAAYPDVIDQFQPGNRAVVIVDGEVFAAGPIERPGGYAWDVGGEEEPGTITINFAGDLSSIAGRLTYPDPDFEAWEQPIAYYESTFNAEAVIRDLVIRNAGIWAKTARRVPKLILGDLAGVGSPIVCKTRFEPVTDVARALAISGGGLGFRVRQVDTDLVFTVYAPEDKSGIARFSRGLGNLISVSYNISKPTATTVIVGGDGEAETRTIVERINTSQEADWGRVEAWVNSSSQDAGSGGLDQAGDEALASSGEEVQLATVTIDAGDVRYGKHYGLGDLVTVEVYEGVELTETVRSAHFTYSPEDGKQISILVGSQDATRDPEWLRLTQRLAGRLGRLERN
jgi:hypothetical protein